MLYLKILADLLDALGFAEKPLRQRLVERLQSVAEQAGGSLERTGERARGAAGGLAAAARRRGSRLREARERSRAQNRAGREAVGERARSLARRAEDIRERRSQRREISRVRRRRRRTRRRMKPLQLDVRHDDRVVLRGRRSIDVRLSDGGVIRYRFYERPSLGRRLYWELTGRQVWPPR